MAIRSGKMSRDYVVPGAIGVIFTLVAGGVGMAFAAPSTADARVTVKTPALADTQQHSYTGPIAMSDFPVNAKGMTYGSDAGVSSPAKAPDLVVVVGDHGVRGFVLAKDLYADTEFATPEEALAYQKKIDAGELPSLPVYDVTDSVVVDTFTTTPGTVS